MKDDLEEDLMDLDDEETEELDFERYSLDLPIDSEDDSEE